MTSTSGELEFLHRPYPYSRDPFKVADQELVAYEGRFFSIPAYGLLLDKRLFTDSASHPVATPIKLYINKDANVTEDIEPTLAASGYERGTPHYADVILDMRTLLEEATDLHAADSPHTADQFFHAHMARVRAVYDLPNSSAPDVPDGTYVHPAPVNAVPSGATPPGASGSVPPPGDGFELGAQQLRDIDIDELQWQPFPRPKNAATATIKQLPVEPIFPAVLPGGSLPTFSSLDESSFNDLGLGAATSGGIVITGDALLDGTSIKLLTGSGMVGASEGAFKQAVPWKLFPCGTELDRYYETTDGNQIVNASGRQAIYSTPDSIPSDVVLLLDVSDAGTSGSVIQTYPANYYATSGIDANGHAHGGVHNVDRLIYNMREMSPGQPVVGRSIINGKAVFAHFAGTETDSKGRDIGGASFKYANGDQIYGAGNITNININNGRTDINWARTSNTMSPISWSSIGTTAWGAAFLPFTRDVYNTYAMADINASNARILSIQQYGGWGFVDRIVAPDQDLGQGGQAKFGTITYTTKIYRQTGKDVNGRIVWTEEPNSPTVHSESRRWYDNTFFVNNIFSFFFNKRPNFGLVSVNGDVYFQWSTKSPLFSDDLPRHNLFAPFGQGTHKLVPATARKEVRTSIGSFPQWVILRYIITNNQLRVPDNIDISPGKSSTITFHPDLQFDDTLVEDFGPACWDAAAGVNYLYFTVRPTPGQPATGYFAKMNTSFQIIQFNAVNSEDLILNGRSAVLSI